MKTRLLSLSVFMMISLSLFAQKNELKAAEKAIKEQDYNTALTELNSAESLMSSMDTKEKAKFHYLKAQAHAGKKEYENAVASYDNLFAEEKASGKDKYTSAAKEDMKQLLQEVNKQASAYYKNKTYDKASDLFYLTYKLSPTDTIFVYNAAIAATLAKDFDKAMEHYKELQKMKYTGITTQYWAVNKTTGVNENLGSKTNRDLFVKAKEYINPSDVKTESKVGDITKNMAYILKEQGKVDEAISAMEEARKLFPKDVNLILAEAEMFFNLGKMDKYSELIKLAVKQEPTNHLLFFNLGVTTFDQSKEINKSLDSLKKSGEIDDEKAIAMKKEADKLVEEAKQYYQKAIDIKPDYGDAYLNLTIAILDKEKAIVDEMNKNLSDFDLYDKLIIKQKEVYKEALPFLEKADKYSRNLNTVQILMNFYETLAMQDKAKEYRDLYNKLSSK